MTFDLHRMAIDHLPIPLFLVSGEGIVLDCSRAAADLFGYDKDNLIGQRTSELIAPQDLSRIPRFHQEEMHMGGATADVTVRKRSGVCFPARCRSRLLPPGDGSLKMILIEDRSNAATGEAVGESTLDSLLPDLSGEPQLMFDLSPDGIVTSANHSALVKFKATPDVLASGIPFIELVDPEQQADVLSAFDRVLSGQQLDTMEVLARRKDGTAIPLMVTARPVYDGDRIVCLHCVALDISYHKAAEQKLLIMEKIHSLGELAGGVVHDFNNILSMILGALHLHTPECRDPACRAAFGRIERAVQDGVAIVRRINNLTNMNGEPAREPVELPDLLEHILELTEPARTDEDCGVRIAVTTHFPPVPPVLANSAELREVFSNIVLNAIQSIEGAGTITVSTMHDREFVHVTVTDSGCGMTPEVRDKMFEPFFTTREKNGGTGLGMSVCYGIVNKLGGEIRVESDPSRGTTVIVAPPATQSADGTTLPAPPGIAAASRSRAARTASTTADVSIPPASGRAVHGRTPTLPTLSSRNAGPSRRILVVDDEETIRDILVELLAGANHRVMAVSRAEEGLDLLADSGFDLVITDLNLPGISGWEMARVVRRDHRAIPIIMLTGWGSNVEVMNRAEHIVARILSKPIDLPLLLQHVRDVTADADA